MDIQGHKYDGKCYVSAGPFDSTTSIVEKKSYAGTSSKTSKQQNEQHLAETISGFLKYEYNYFGYIQGTFKLNQNPVATEFDHNYVAQRGQILVQTPQVICLVLNLGDQCIGNVFKTSQEMHEVSTIRNRFRRIFRKQKLFDQAYFQSLRAINIVLVCILIFETFIMVYINRIGSTLIYTKFEQHLF